LSSFLSLLSQDGAFSEGAWSRAASGATARARASRWTAQVASATATATAERTSSRPGRRPNLLRPAVLEGLQEQTGAGVQEAPGAGAELVAGEGGQVGRLERWPQPLDPLAGVEVDQRAQLPGPGSDLGDRLNGPNLVVGQRD